VADSQVGLKLYLRSGCSLCEAMILELQELEGIAAAAIDYLDVDGDPHWQRDYGDKVPLLHTQDGVELSRYFLEPQVVLRHLQNRLV
jgi:hypothetical protein